MKLLYFANIRIPTEKAHGQQIVKMCELFAMKKIDVKLIVPRRLNPEYKKVDIFAHYKVQPIFVLKKIIIIDPRIILKIIPSYYIKFQLLFFNISLFFWFVFKKINNQEIFYTRDEYLLPLLNLFSKKVIWEAHSLPKSIKFYLPYLKKSYRLIVLTEQIRKDLINLGVPSEKVLVASDAVDLKIFDIEIYKIEARKILQLPQDKIILGYTGSLQTKGLDKGVNDIISAIKLSPFRNDVILVAVGGSQLDIDFYLKIADQQQVKENIIFVPKVEQSKLAIYQKAFDILLMPFPNIKHYAYYMSPLKLFEYMASERPIIASDLPSLREVLNENNAVFCQADNPQSLINKIKLLIDNQALVMRISSQAKKDVQKFTWENRVDKIVNFIGN
jgi:glycosyltransferase involved in cell wall biosynthesis